MLFMWPRNSPLLQIKVVMCLVILVFLRVTNVFVPIYYKAVVNQLSVASPKDAPSSWPWEDVTIWVVLKLLQGSGMGQGLLNKMRAFIWIKVQQFTQSS